VFLDGFLAAALSCSMKAFSRAQSAAMAGHHQRRLPHRAQNLFVSAQFLLPRCHDSGFLCMPCRELSSTYISPLHISAHVDAAQPGSLPVLQRALSRFSARGPASAQVSEPQEAALACIAAASRAQQRRRLR